MPTWLSEVLKLIGFTTPLYAVMVYGFFHYLDKKASGSAKKAISGWLQPREYDKAAVADATVEIFDRLYTRPLLGWRAFRRSALFTLCMTAIFVYESENFPSVSHVIEAGWAERPLTALQAGQVSAWVILIVTTLGNMIGDYVALFIIRPLLIIGKRRPLVALLLGPLAGISVVFLAFGFFVAISVGLIKAFVEFRETPVSLVTASLVWQALLPAGFVVHLWLPLFALCVVLLRGLNYFRLAVGGTQWFLKGGRENPLDAIGYVGAVLAFVATVVIQHIA
jgi:hypothetical protein